MVTSSCSRSIRTGEKVKRPDYRLHGMKIENNALLDSIIDEGKGRGLGQASSFIYLACRLGIGPYAAGRGVW